MTTSIRKLDYNKTLGLLMKLSEEFCDDYDVDLLIRNIKLIEKGEYDYRPRGAISKNE